MMNALRAFGLGILLIAPLAVNAAMWEFAGGLNIVQSVAADAPDCADTGSCTIVPFPYFGGGFVDATFNDATGEFTWDYEFAGLSGPALAAHFHEAPPGSPGLPVVTTPIAAVTIGAASGSTTLVGDVLDDAIAALTGGGTFVPGDITGWYLNIHTGLNPPGELRGQLFVTFVPIPAALWMMISALGALTGWRRFA